MHVHKHFIPRLGYQENYLPKRIKESGHDISIITSKYKPQRFKEHENDSFESGVYEYNNVKVYRLDTYLNMEKSHLMIFKNFKKTLNDIDPEIIQARSAISLATIQCLNYSKNNDVKLFVDSHIDNDNFHLDTLYKKLGFKLFKNLLLRNLISNTEMFLPVNPFAKKFLKNIGIPNKKIELLPLGADSNLFHPNEKARNEIRESLGVQKNEVLFIFTGIINPSKDIETMIKALSKVTKKSSNVKLLLLGEGDNKYIENIKNMISTEELEDQVIFHDFVDHSDLPKYFNAADVGIFPGKLGISILEAVATGLPVIVSDSTATKYIISNNNGFLIKRGNIEELTNKILRYSQEPTLRKKHQRNALEIVKEELSWKKIAEKSINIYTNNII